MPKAIYLLACENVITSEEGQISFISMLQQLTLHVPMGAEVPNKSFAPKTWVIVSVIRHSDPSEINKKFIHHIEVFKPDGTLTAGKASRIPFVMDEKGYLNKVNVTGIPVDIPGTLSIKLWIYEEGQSKPDIPPQATYDEITIVHKIVEPASEMPDKSLFFID